MAATTEALIVAIPSPPLPLPSPPLPLPAPSLPLLLPATDPAAAARQPGLDVTHAIDYSFVDIMHATPGRPMSGETTIPQMRIAKLFIDPCGGGVRGGDGFGVLWGVNEVENDRFGGLCDLAGKLVEDVQYFNFQKHPPRVIYVMSPQVLVVYNFGGLAELALVVNTLGSWQ
ncbi:hypothetical protein Tco_0331367 [Tanacetum coccineum]